MKDNMCKLKDQIEFYNTKYEIPQDKIPEFDYYIADDMIGTFKQFAETKDQIAQLEKYPDSINGNGCIVFTIDNRNFTIIINNNQFNGNDDYIHTILHEYTHVLDYSRYMKENDISNFDNFLLNKHSDAFYLWTEYHARLIGTDNYYKYITQSYDINFDEQLLYKFEQLGKELSQFEQNKIAFLKVMYNVTQHFARFSVFANYGVNPLGNLKFPKNQLENLLSTNIIEYNKLLFSNSTYDKIKVNDNLDELSNIVDNIQKYTWEHVG